MDNERWYAYNFSALQYTVAAQIVLDEFCNGITIKNSGNMLCTIGGDQLNPGESKSIGGNRKEILRGRYDISFQTPTPAPATPNPLAVITQKFFVALCSDDIDQVRKL